MDKSHPKNTPQRQNWRSMLKARPVRNTAATTRENDDNQLCVVVKTQKPRYMFPPISWFVPYNPQREVILDSVGKQLWLWCDGQRDVEEIIDLFKDKYQLSFHEAKTGVTDYFKKLVQRGVLAVVMDKD